MALDSATFNNSAALKDTKTDAATGVTVDTYYDATTFEIIGVENKDASGNTTFKSTKTEDTTGYSAAAEVTANAALNLTGDKAEGGKVTNTTAEKVSITSAGDDSGIFYDVTGKTALGEVVTERIAGANDGTAQTTVVFLEVTEVRAVGDPAGTVSLAGEGYTEVVEQTETRKETNTAGEKVDVTFAVEKTINYDGSDKIKSGTEKIDGREKTLGENGVVTAETMDTSLLGDAISGDTLVAVAARYDSVAANATIYAEEENLGGGTTVTTLYAANNTIVGSSDTSVETFNNITLTVTNHFAAPVTDAAGEIAAGEYIGTSGTDGTNTWDFTKTEVTTDLNADGVSTFTNTPAYKETGSESYGGETRSFTYFFNKATGELLSGTEVVDGITTTFGPDWLVTAEAMDPGSLGEALASTVLDGLPASVQAATGNTYSKTESFEWGGGETTYFNALGVTTGFAYTWADASGNSNNSFYDASDNYVGDSWSDAEGRSGSSSFAIAADGSWVETGSYADTSYSAGDYSWTYEYNSVGVLTKSVEIQGDTTTTTENGTTTTAVDIDDLATFNLANVSDDIKNAFFTGMTTVYTSTETYAWGGSLQTFIHTDGSIIGYADSYSDDWDGDGTADSSGTTYMKADWSYVGSAWSDSWGTGQRFETNKDKDGDALASDLTREFGTDSWSDGAGGQETRTYDYTFDTSGQYWELDGGTETGSDGVTTVYGADWLIISQKGDTTKLGAALSTAELVGVPTSIKSALADAETYAKTAVYDWGTDTTYYDSTGTILGYANASTWDMDDGGSNTNKSYHDADWNWLGGSWADKDASGGIIRSGSNSTVNTYSTDANGDVINNANGDPIKTSFVDSGSYREGDEGSSYSWTFNVTYDANGYENHAMAGGTEVRGTYNASDVLVGTTYTYGADWMLTGAKADTSNLATLDLSTLDASLVTALFGSANAVIKFSTETFDWNQGFSQQTFYNANGDIVGYGDSWSDDWDGDGVIDSTGQSYMDANWDYVGGSYSDDYGSGHSFTIKTVVNDVVTQIQEIGENTYTDYDGNSQTNKYDFTYDANWNLLGGTEERGQKDAAGDLSGGETVTYGANWEVLSVSRDVDLSSAKIAELTAVDLAGIPTALHAATGKTYVETEVNSWGTQKTYLDSDGQILGYSDAWSDDWDGDGNPDSVGTSYQDADWNHLGSTYDDEWSTGFHHTVESYDANGDVTGYIETSSRTDKMTNEVTESSFTFDLNWNMLGGTETRGDTVDANGDLAGTETTYGANWVILSQETSMVGVATVDVSGLPASVQTLLFAGETLTAVKAVTDAFPWGGSQTTYFDANGNVLGYMDTYSDDWDGDGNVDSSGTSFMDASWNYIGGTYADEWGSGSNFTVLNDNTQTIDGVVYDGTRVDSGTSSWTNHDDVVETRTFEYTFDLNYNLIQGTETSSNGTTTTYGKDWEVVGSSISVGNLVALTPNELFGLPAPLKAAVGDTFAKVQDWGQGSNQTTYIDANGNILGYHDTWTDSYTNNGSLETFSGSSYMDANWNHLGGSSTMAVDGVVTNSSSSITIHSYDVAGDVTGWVESGSNTWKDGNDTMTSSFIFNFDANGDMTGGSEVRPDGTTVTLGANWAFVGEAISVTGLQAISQADFDLLPGSITGATAAATLFKDTSQDHGGVIMGGMVNNMTNVEKTLLSADGTVLGYWQTFSDDWDGDSVVDYVNTTFMDANWNWLGGSGADYNTDSGFGVKWSQVSADVFVNNVKTGYTETRSETEKNVGVDSAGADGAFTGMSRTTVTEYDTAGMMVGKTEISTLPNGDKMQFVFNEFSEVIGEYTYTLKVAVGNQPAGTPGDDLTQYDKVITDKYALFQLEKFIITDDFMKGFAEREGITNLSDADGDGIADAYTADFDGDGVADLTNHFMQSMIDATVFAGSPVPNFAIANDPNSPLTGFTFIANGLKMVWVGEFTLVANPTANGGPDNIASGTITEAYIYDNANGSLVGYSDSLTLNFMDIKSFMDAQPMAPVYNIDGPLAVNSAANAYTAFVPGDDDMWEITKVDVPFFDKLVAVGFDLNGVDSQGNSNITAAMINAVMTAEDPNFIPADVVFSLTDLMGGAATYADVAPTTGSGPMNMGGEQRYDAMGNNVSVEDDGFGNITEMMVDPDNANIQIKTEYLSNGDVVVTQLITDPRGFVEEVQMGSGSKVEGTYFDEVSTSINGLDVTEREYEMSNVYSKVEVDAATGGKTEFSSDARGIDTTLIVAGDGSFGETIAAADGKTTISKSVDALGQMTVKQSVLDANGDPVLNSDGSLSMETVGSGTSMALVGGGRVDTTFRNDGSKSLLNVAANGDETLETYTATVSEQYLTALTVYGWGDATAAANGAPATLSTTNQMTGQPVTYTSAGPGTTNFTTDVITVTEAFNELLAMNGSNLAVFPFVHNDTFITEEMILAVGGAVPVAVVVGGGAGGGGGWQAHMGPIPAVGAAVTVQMENFLANAGAPPSISPTYTLAGTSESKQLEDGSTEQTTTVGTQKVITTHSVQEDGSLKAVTKTEAGTTLKEEITSFDEAGAPTVTAKEYLGENHTRVTVSDAETKTVVTTEAGAVTKAVKDIAADKTVTTSVSADNEVVVTEQIGHHAAAVTTATGTLSVAAGTGVETLALTTVNAAGTVTGSEVITVKSDGTEEKTTKDTSGNTLSAVETSEGNDGTVRVSTTQDGIETETFIFVSGESVTFTTNTSDGSVVVMEKVLSGGRLVEQQLGTGTQTSSGDVTTLIMDLGNGETATIVSNDVTGIEESTFQTNGVTTQFVREETDDSGNDIILSQTYSGGVVSDTTERVISVDNTVQDKVTSATGDITLTESGVDGSGKAFSKVLGTGKSEVVGGVTVDTITLSDNSTVVEKFDAAGEMTEKSVADQGGDAKISTFNGGVETIAYADINGQAIDKSAVDIKVDIGFSNEDLGFQNLDYADMAGGFTSQAGDFDMSIDYSNTELATSDGGYGGASSAASGDAATTNTLGYNGTNNSTNNNNGPAEDLTAFSDYFSDSLNDTPPIPDFY